jgi:hypothetical protein
MDHLENVKELHPEELAGIKGGSDIGYWLGYALGYVGKGLTMVGAVNIALDLMKK